MIWLTWRQFRAQAVTAAAALALFAILLAVTHPQLASLYVSTASPAATAAAAGSRPTHSSARCPTSPRSADPRPSGCCPPGPTST